MSENSIDPIHESLKQLFTAIEICIEKKLQLPALMLIYSGLDIAGYLSASEERPVRESFIDWVDAYLLKSKRLHCTALELYAARCGLLHTLSSKSKLSDNGEVRRFIYAFGPIKKGVEEKDFVETNPLKFITIHIDDLFEEYTLGMTKFFKEVVDDPVKLAALEAKADWYWAWGVGENFNRF